MRFAYSRRTFLTAVLLVTVIGRVLAEDRVLELAIHNADSPREASTTVSSPERSSCSPFDL
jgi:hypothetical protein